MPDGSIVAHGALTEAELARVRTWFSEATGVSMARLKAPLVAGRLSRRLRALGFASFTRYVEEIVSGRNPAEAAIAIDLLTTHETRFFREPAHFDRLRLLLAGEWAGVRPLRVWSAACSSGEEAYSIAITLAGAREGGWEVVASDVSRGVLERATAGIYPMRMAEQIPRDVLARHCLRGVGPRQGTFAIDPELRRHVRFSEVNLNEDLPHLGKFTAIFLRNVMIYFDHPTKVRVVERIARLLEPGGYLFIGHSETLSGFSGELRQVATAVYRLPA